MSTFRPTEQSDGWMLMLEEDLAGIRERLAELSLGADRDRREASALQDRVRETEALALRAISQSSAMSVRIDEIQTMRERLGRFQSSLDERDERFDVALRQLRHEVGVERESLAHVTRRLDAAEHASNEIVERLSAIDVAVDRVSDDAGELTQRVALADSHREANDARIAANTEAVRRAHAEQRAMEARADAGERKVDELSERVNAALQSLRRVTETSDQWDDLAATIEAMRGRAEDSRRMLDEASAMAASVRRSFEAFEERMGDIERGAEQLRSRDGHRERALAALGDEVEQIRDEASREQHRFVALQEQIRRRQINDLEQEIRELKSYARVQSDD